MHVAVQPVEPRGVQEAHGDVEAVPQRVGGAGLVGHGQPQPLPDRGMLLLVDARDAQRHRRADAPLVEEAALRVA